MVKGKHKSYVWRKLTSPKITSKRSSAANLYWRLVPATHIIQILEILPIIAVMPAISPLSST